MYNGNSYTCDYCGETQPAHQVETQVGGTWVRVTPISRYPLVLVGQPRDPEHVFCSGKCQASYTLTKGVPGGVQSTR